MRKYRQEAPRIVSSGCSLISECRRAQAVSPVHRPRCARGVPPPFPICSWSFFIKLLLFRQVSILGCSRPSLRRDDSSGILRRSTWWWKSGKPGCILGSVACLPSDQLVQYIPVRSSSLVASRQWIGFESSLWLPLFDLTRCILSHHFTVGWSGWQLSPSSVLKWGKGQGFLFNFLWSCDFLSLLLNR